MSQSEHALEKARDFIGKVPHEYVTYEGCIEIIFFTSSGTLTLLYNYAENSVRYFVDLHGAVEIQSSSFWTILTATVLMNRLF